MPRRDALTDDIQRRVCDLVRVGNYLETAVVAVGIDLATHDSWMERGQKAGKAHAPYRAYREAIEHALAESESLAVTLISRAARDDWRAGKFLLQRGQRGTFRPLAAPTCSPPSTA